MGGFILTIGFFVPSGKMNYDPLRNQPLVALYLLKILENEFGDSVLYFKYYKDDNNKNLEQIKALVISHPIRLDPILPRMVFQKLFRIEILGEQQAISIIQERTAGIADSIVFVIHSYKDF